MTGFAIDHRKVAPGAVFGAFEGALVNGEDFIPAAVASGAIGVVARPQAQVTGAAHLADPLPRRAFARLAARFFRPVPPTIVAVTGTNGKTSTVEMTRQIWRMCGERAASIGTLGVTTPDESVSTGLTTPDIVTFLSNMVGLAREGVTHVAYEASSHGLSQYRNEGLPVAAGAFTNFSRDHLDYHADLEDYFAAKMRLFAEVVEEGGTALVWADDAWAERAAKVARERGLRVFSIGEGGDDIRLLSRRTGQLGQELEVEHGGERHKIMLPLIGAYQAANALMAAGLAIVSGSEPARVFDALARLQPVRGRLERAVITSAGTPVYVDYAHTPDALAAAIAALRPHVGEGGRLIAVFGAGGDRDHGKRGPMGEVAARDADVAIVTDDNPRGEDPGLIRAAIIAGAPGGAMREIAGRREAIATAIGEGSAGDVVLIAGKGHEQGQILEIDGQMRILAFDGRDRGARKRRRCARRDIGMSALARTLRWPAADRRIARPVLWTARAIADAVGGIASAEFELSGVEMDSRDVRSGDLFLALKGDSTDGHRFIDKAFANGAAAALVERPIEGPHILVEDTGAALAGLARAARQRVRARIVGVTGSVGKTGVKEAIFTALERSGRGTAHRSVKSYNNHVGVPLSLARMPTASRFGVFEMGMNHAGEITDLTTLVRPNVAVITTIAPAHIENLGSEEAIADAKAEIFAGLEPGGTAVIPADSPHFERLRDAARARGAKILSFGTAAHAHLKLLDTIPSANGGSLVTAALGEQRLCYTVAEPGEHWVANSLCVMAAVKAAGGDLGAAGLALAEMGGLKGRGARMRIAVPGGHALLIDESYNANPASMRATLAQLGATPATRRVAVLGAMKELGDFGPEFHARLADPLEAAHADFAVLVGEEMIPLARELRSREILRPELGKGGGAMLGKHVRFAHANNAGEAIAALEQFGLTAGDAVLVKGSNSVGLARLVGHFAAHRA